MKDNISESEEKILEKSNHGPSDEAEDEAVKLMRSKLPAYIQDCLLVSGFDIL